MRREGEDRGRGRSRKRRGYNGVVKKKEEEGEKTGGRGRRAGRWGRRGGGGGERRGLNINDPGQGKVEGQYKSYSPYHNIFQHMNGIVFFS